MEKSGSPNINLTLLPLAAAGWVTGIALANFFALPTVIWFLLLALPLGYLLIWWRDPRLRLFHICLLALVLGALRFQVLPLSSANSTLSNFNDRGRASLIGVVVDEPDQRDAYTNLRVGVTKIQSGGQWQDAQGTALVQVPRDTPIRYGDEVQVDGTPETPPDGADFSYRDFLARASIFTLVRFARGYVITGGQGNPIWAALLDIKAHALVAINQFLPEPSASLLSGILLGHDQGIPRELVAAFNRTNTSHIIAISGFNIAIIAGFLSLLFRKLTPRFADLLIILALIGYTALVGASASVVRAAIMGTLGVIAIRYGRQTLALNSLAVAAVLMTLLNPYVLWDVGFQLSFLATLGMIFYVPPLTSWLERQLNRVTTGERTQQILAILEDAFIVTVAATITTTPLIVATFHRLSLIGFLTNFLILPVQPPIMIFGGIATILQMLADASSAVPFLGIIIGALAQVVGWFSYLFLQYTITIVQLTAAVPWASIEIPRVDPAFVLLTYALIFLFTRYSPRRVARFMFSRTALAVLLIVFVSLFVWTTALAAPDPRTHIRFIATSGGDAIFVRTAQGEKILIDGSSEPSALLGAIGSQLVPWDRRLDAVIATHLDDANLASLNSVAERFTIANILQPSHLSDPPFGYTKWRDLLSKQGAPVTDAQTGAELKAKEIKVEALYPTEASPANVLALKLNTGAQTFLIAPALTPSDLRKLAPSNADLNADVAVLPPRFDRALLDRIKPQIVILFVGRAAREQPDPASLKLLDGITVLRTDERGTIDLIVDNGQLTVQSAR